MNFYGCFAAMHLAWFLINIEGNHFCHKTGLAQERQITLDDYKLYYVNFWLSGLLILIFLLLKCTSWVWSV